MAMASTEPHLSTLNQACPGKYQVVYSDIHFCLNLHTVIKENYFCAFSFPVEHFCDKLLLRSAYDEIYIAVIYRQITICLIVYAS